MGLHIVLGFKTNLSTAKPEVVYLGASGSEARGAMDAQAGQFARFAVLNNPPSYRKAGKLKTVEAAPAAGAPEVPQTSDTAEAEQAAAAEAPADEAPKKRGKK